MQLQFAAEHGSAQSPIELPLIETENELLIDWRPLFTALIERFSNETVCDLARLFHDTLSNSLLRCLKRLPKYPVVLTGGCFQNRLLLKNTLQLLEREKFSVYWPRQIPANDGGIAFGQAAIGIRKLMQSQTHSS